MHSTVRIMMATYNGEKYLKEQLDSILRQTYSSWSLIIQDDGSVDGTWKILTEYADRDSRISVRKSREAKHGAYYNFHSIANQEKYSGILYDYYMFCDQDDIWDAEKIEKMLSIFQEKKSTEPYLIYGDMRVVDSDKRLIIKSVAREQGLFYKNPNSLFICHNIYGCNTMMNKEAFMCVPIIDTSEEIVSILCHDNLYAKFTGIFGKVEYFDFPLMSYRRHGENATSAQQYGFAIKRILKRSTEINCLAKDHARIYRQSLYAIKLLFDVNEKSNESLKTIEKCLRGYGVRSIILYLKLGIDCGKQIKNISRCIILLFGLHRKFL